MKLRKVMALTLAGTMALAAVGCGSDASTTNDAPAASTATETKTETKTETATETAQAQETSLEDVKNLNDGKLVIWTLANDLIDFGERFQEKTGVEVETVVKYRSVLRHSQKEICAFIMITDICIRNMDCGIVKSADSISQRTLLLSTIRD